MRLPRLVRCLALLASIGMLTSCGDDASTTKPADVSEKAVFLTKANALCTTLDAKLAASQSAMGANPSDDQVRTFIRDVLVPELGSTVDAIRDLGFPAGDEELLDGLMDETQVVLDSLAEDPNPALSLDEPRFVSINERLTAYGLNVCGSS
jgi:hypothetical protein